MSLQATGQWKLHPLRTEQHSAEPALCHEAYHVSGPVNMRKHEVQTVG